jgi:hypothetical protein
MGQVKSLSPTLLTLVILNIDLIMGNSIRTVKDGIMATTMLTGPRKIVYEWTVFWQSWSLVPSVNQKAWKQHKEYGKFSILR